MAEVIQVTTAPGLTFDVLVDGPEQGAPVLLLHGFAELFHHWDAQIAALARAGYRAIAPSQRGYSPGARPDPANTDNYVFDRLVDDPMQIAAQLGLTRFHLVGHDWGGSIAWGIADKHPGAARLAHHPVAPASERLQPRARFARRRAEASLAPSSRIPRAGRGRRRARQRCRMAARALGCGRRAEGRAGQAPCGARQSGRHGSGARLVSRARRDPLAARRDPRADALHLGRCRRHGRPPRPPNGRASSSQRRTNSPCCRAAGISPPTRCRKL